MKTDDVEEDDVRDDDNSDDNDDNQLWTTSNCHRPTNHPVTFNYPGCNEISTQCSICLQQGSLSQKSRKFPRTWTEYDVTLICSSFRVSWVWLGDYPFIRTLLHTSSSTTSTKSWALLDSCPCCGSRSSNGTSTITYCFIRNQELFGTLLAAPRPYITPSTDQEAVVWGSHAPD